MDETDSAADARRSCSSSSPPSPTRAFPSRPSRPKFTGRFNKGVDYVGDVAQFETEFNDDLAVIALRRASTTACPPSFKLSVHSGSDKFSIYGPIRRALQGLGAGLHLKTAGTTWLEELIGLAEAGGDGLALAKEIYAKALAHRDELCAPYATVIDIDRAKLPTPAEVNGWTSEQFTAALRHDPNMPRLQSALPPVAARRLSRSPPRWATAISNMLKMPASRHRANVTDKPLRAPHEAAFRSVTQTMAFHPRRLPPAAPTPPAGSTTASPRAEPILDYHCHLPPKDIAEQPPVRQPVRDLARRRSLQVARHARQRRRRSASAPATPRPARSSWPGPRTVPHTLRNPLYHWTHLELKRYFGIDELLDESTADEHLGAGQRTARHAGAQRPRHPEEVQGQRRLHHGRSRPTTSRYHTAIAGSGLATRVFPTFRPDKALTVHQPEAFNAWVDRLGRGRQRRHRSFPDFLDALEQRHDFFHAHGLPPLRPRPEPLLRRLLLRRRRRPRSSTRARAGQRGHAGGTSAVRRRS